MLIEGEDEIELRTKREIGLTRFGAREHMVGFNPWAGDVACKVQPVELPQNHGIMLASRTTHRERRC